MYFSIGLVLSIPKEDSQLSWQWHVMYTATYHIEEMWRLFFFWIKSWVYTTAMGGMVGVDQFVATKAQIYN